MDLRVATHYKLKRKLGSGAFGEIFLAQHVKTKEEVAVKLEETRCKFPQLKYEYKLYKYFERKDAKQSTGIPKVYYYNTEGQYNVMVMDLLGKSLDDLLKPLGGRYTVKTTLMLAD